MDEASLWKKREVNEGSLKEDQSGFGPHASGIRSMLALCNAPSIVLDVQTNKEQLILSIIAKLFNGDNADLKCVTLIINGPFIKILHSCPFHKNEQ